MRGATSLLLRWICSLALVVAAWPARAAEMPCVTPVSKIQSCGMSCCAPKASRNGPNPAMACHQTAKHGIAKKADSCPCEIKSSTPAPAAVEKTVPTISNQVVAILPPTPAPVKPQPIETRQPGIVGSDSGPPPTAKYRNHFGRAPPVSA